MYRFQLKVYDVAGQSSTAQVDVFVRRPATSEPHGILLTIFISILVTDRYVSWDSWRGEEYGSYSSFGLGCSGWLKIEGGWRHWDPQVAVGPARVIEWIWNVSTGILLLISNFRGPNTAVLFGNDKSQVNVTSLTKGLYVFQLTAWDDSGVSGIDNVTISVLQSKQISVILAAFTILFSFCWFYLLIFRLFFCFRRQRETKSECRRRSVRLPSA